MANFWAAVLALALNCNVVYVFTKAEDYDSFLYPTYLMFLIGVFALLWDSCIYPVNFRRLYFICEFFIEFVLVTFLMEFILIEFLMPLEKSFIEFIPSIAECIQSLMSGADLDIEFVNDFCELLKSDDVKTAASCALGLFFLISISQATRLIDLRILKCDGVGAFIGDATERTQKFYQQLFGSPPCGRNRCRRQNYCSTHHQEPSRLFDIDDSDDDIVDPRYTNCRIAQK